MSNAVTKSDGETLPYHDPPCMICPDEVIPVQAELHNDILILSGFGLKTQALSGQNPSRFVMLRWFVG